jgi:hypothetical protein
LSIGYLGPFLKTFISIIEAVSDRNADRERRFFIKYFYEIVDASDDSFHRNHLGRIDEEYKFISSISTGFIISTDRGLENFS